MLVQQARSVIWLELTLALLRKKTKGIWTEKHRNAVRKIFLEGGWVHKRLFDIGWSDESKCQACHKEEGTDKHRLYRCPEWHEVRRGIPDAFRKWEQKAKTSKKGIAAHPLSEGPRNRGSLQNEKVGV